jgi:3'(2'), 5'-bisphosphate nucleotidase
MPFNREVIGATAIAQKNQGAVLESLDGTFSRTLSVSKQSDLQRVHIALGNVRHLDQKVVERLLSNNQINGTIIQISSQAKYVAVADGQIDLFLRYATDTDHREKVWDHVAGELIVREAGGCVTDLDGKELNFSKGELLTENRGLLVTNRQIHENLLQIIHDYI